MRLGRSKRAAHLCKKIEAGEPSMNCWERLCQYASQGCQGEKVAQSAACTFFIEARTLLYIRIVTTTSCLKEPSTFLCYSGTFKSCSCNEVERYPCVCGIVDPQPPLSGLSAFIGKAKRL